MNYILLFFSIFFASITITSAQEANLKEDLTIRSLKEIKQPNNLLPSNSILIELTNPSSMTANIPNNITFKLLQSSNKTLVSNNLLESVNNVKLHAYLTNASFTDYQHLHPTFLEKDGTFNLSFNPHTNEAYKLWITMKIISTTREEYVTVNLGPDSSTSNILERENLFVEKGNYSYKLEFDQTPQLNHLVRANIAVRSKSHKSLKQALPDMKKSTQLIGFYPNQNSIFHLYPDEREDSTDAINKNAIINFNWLPEYKGIAKIFAEFKIDGKTIIIPFTVKVN